MPVVEIDGIGRVELGNEFMSLSPEQQNATIQEIASSRRGNVSVKSNTTGASTGDIAADVAKSGGVGLGKGAIGLAGMVGDASDLLAAGTNYAGNKIAGVLGGEPYALPDKSRTINQYVPTSKSIQGAIEENVTGEFYKPQTVAGEYAQTVGEFIPGALAGPGGMARNTAAFGIIPGLTSEFAGQQTKGTKLEPWARGGAAVLSGGVSGVLTAPGNAAQTIGRTAHGVDRNVLAQAEALFQEAQAAGMPLTRPEAIQAVTNGATNFGNLQRVVEGQGAMKPFFAERAGQTDAAAGRVFDQVTPAAPNPSAIGPAVGTAAEGTIDDVRGAVNAASDPFYTQAATIRLTPYEMQRVRALPGYPEARDAVRNDPQLARYVRGLPEDSVGFLNEVKKHLDTAAENAAAPVNQQRNMQRSAGYGLDATAARDIGVNASRRTPGNPYETALNIQSQGRDRFLQPLLDGPLGKIAARDTATKKAIDVLFPNNPLPNSADEIATAVRAVSQRNAYAARNLVRAHLEMTFNEATQHLASGVNSYGGAKFAAIVRGNPQQAANLEAAIRALPNGDQTWQGVDRFLTILEAQGQRQAIGSQTAFNQEVLQDLRQGKLASEAGSAALSGGLKLPTKIKDRVERWRMGSNVDELARLFTDPTAGREFARLANAGTGINPVGSLVRLVGLAMRPPPNEQK
jgi:hypothetical protein